MSDASLHSVDDFMRGVAAQVDVLDGEAERQRDQVNREATERDSIEQEFAWLMVIAAEVLKREGVPTALEWVDVPREPVPSWQHGHTAPAPREQVSVWRLGGGHASWGVLLKPDGTAIGSTYDLQRDAEGTLIWYYNDGDRVHSGALAPLAPTAVAQLIRNHRDQG